MDYAYCHFCKMEDIHKDDWDTHWQDCKEHPAGKVTRVLRDQSNNYLLAWAGLSKLVRSSYNYGDYCYWCERSVKGTDESHADDCELIAALVTLPEDAVWENVQEAQRMSQEMGVKNE